jgi:hypothetical protein
MTHPIFDALAARRPGVDALAAGQGDPLDLAAACLPDVPAALARAAAREVDARVAPSFADPDAHPDAGPLRLAVAATLAELLPDAGSTRRWADHARGLIADAESRPTRWRALSEDALALSAALTLDGRGAALLDAVANAALHVVPPAALHAAQELVAAAARRARLEDARRWLRLVPPAARPSFDRAFDQLAQRAVPMAAAAEAPAALARVVLGHALDGEVTLAVLPTGLAVEWDGDGAPPDTLHVDDRAARPLPAGASLAKRGWWLDADIGDVTLTRGDTVMTVAQVR